MSELLKNKISTRNHFVSQESIFLEYGINGLDKKRIIQLFNLFIMKKIFKDIKKKKDLSDTKKKILQLIHEYEVENTLSLTTNEKHIYVKILLHLLLDSSKYTTKKMADTLHDCIKNMDIDRRQHKICCVKRKLKKRTYT